MPRRTLLFPPLVAAVALLGASASLPFAVATVTAQEASPAASPMASPVAPIEVPLINADEEDVGSATFAEGAEGVTVSVSVDGLEPGDHGVHVHEMGLCDAAGEEPFTTAGDHYNPTGAMHGAPDDPSVHAGDLGNITVDDDGRGTLEIATDRFTLAAGATSLFDENGSALLIHAEADDLVSQPGGGSGARVACGVVADPAAAQAAQPIAVTSSTLNPEQVPFGPDTVGQLQAPDGFEISVFAQGMANPRQMAIGPDGTVFVTETGANQVLALRDTDGDGAADESSVVASDLKLVHGIVIRDEQVFLAGEKQVWVADLAADGTLGEPQVLIDGLPDGDQHGRRTIGFGPDGMLYVQIGSSCNACIETDRENATILRANADGSGREIFASGLRNTLAWTWHPETGELWGMDHGIDHKGNDQPPEELNRIVEGGNYGWPFCFGEREPNLQLPYPPPGATFAQYCANSEAPVLTYQAHSAPIDLVFYDADQFPAEYQGDAFVTMRGSWNRDPATGYKLVRVRFEDGQPVAIDDFVTGWLADDGASHFGRIAGLAVAPDGSLLVTDDTNGVVYRVAYVGG